MKTSRVFAMPSGETLSIKPIKEWARAHLHGVIVDPFARNCRLGTFRNDLNPETSAEYHMDAEAFCALLAERGVEADCAIFDPPYSPRQISEVYQSIGRECGTRDTQNAALYKRVRDRLDAILKPGGVVLSFGWNSNGMGDGRGYIAEEMLLVRHGGAHNDTICLLERKGVAPADLFGGPAE